MWPHCVTFVDEHGKGVTHLAEHKVILGHLLAESEIIVDESHLLGHGSLQLHHQWVAELGIGQLDVLGKLQQLQRHLSSDRTKPGGHVRAPVGQLFLAFGGVLLRVHHYLLLLLLLGHLVVALIVVYIWCLVEPLDLQHISLYVVLDHAHRAAHLVFVVVKVHFAKHCLDAFHEVGPLVPVQNNNIINMFLVIITTTYLVS